MERGGSFLYLYFFIAASLPSTLSISLLRGVSPLEEKYFESVVIACRDGSKSFPRSRLNDGFCDCIDGTDEPGTSACPESKFYCVNIGSTPQLLFSSRVNDHICDCCDGSDEYDSGTYCRNTCVMDENLSKNNVKYNTKINIDDTGTIKRMNRSNLEDLFKNLKELKLLVMMEVVLVCCVIMFGLSRLQIRSRRRQHH